MLETYVISLWLEQKWFFKPALISVNVIFSTVISKGLDEIITTLSSQRYQNIITQIITTKFNMT